MNKTPQAQEKENKHEGNEGFTNIISWNKNIRKKIIPKKKPIQRSKPELVQGIEQYPRENGS